MYLRASSGGSATQAAISKTGRTGTTESNIETNDHEQVQFRYVFRQPTLPNKHQIFIKTTN